MMLMRRFLITACVTSLLLCASVVGADETERIRQTFEAYKTALLSGDGVQAASLVSQATTDYYTDMHRAAICGSRDSIQQLSLINRMQVVLLRHRVPRRLLIEMTGRQAFAYAVANGWIGKDSVIQATVGDIDVRDDVAVAQHIGQNGPSAVNFQFVQERGVWKFDLIPLIEVSNAALAIVARQQGIEEDQLLIQLIESVSGNQAPETIWQPIMPEAALCTAP